LHIVYCRRMAGYKNQRHKRLADLLQYHLQKVTGALSSVGREPVVVGTTRANDGVTTT
jgi:hypothetical protein